MTQDIIELVLFVGLVGLIWVSLDLLGEGPGAHDDRC
jgi:hypothetical protein